MVSVKRERGKIQSLSSTAAVTEPEYQNSRLSRSNSVATMVDGPVPYRASSVRASSVLPTPAHTSHGSTSPADRDVEMTNSTAQAAPDAMEKLGTHSRAVIQAIQRLSALNINTTLKSLPKIVVIGDQSAGKSSVIEALCDISLPRNEGKCTSCPFQLTTTSSTTGSSPWTCKIFLQVKYAYQPKQAARQPKEQYTHWAEQKDSELYPFATVYQKEDLEQALRRAQQAILNPGRDYRDFCNMPIGAQSAATQVEFSPNVVCLEIASANLPELSFYDLPGAINSTSEEENEYLVDFVEALIKSYAGDEKAIVLLACAANQDIETSTAIRFLRSCKTTDGRKACDRVMGVLTKPDLVDDNADKIAEIHRILSGKSYEMGHNWFVTKQLCQKELRQGVSHQQAREREATFFAAGPWAHDPGLAAYDGRFGTANLQNALSQLLTRHILCELPGIVARVEHRLADVDRKLATFPVQDAAPTIAIIQEIEQLKAKIVSKLNPDAISTFRTQYRDIYREMQKDLARCKPQANLVTPGYVKKSITLDDSDDEESPSKKSKPNHDSRGFSATPRRTPGPGPSSGGSDRKRKTVTTNGSAGPATFVKFDLEQIKRKFDSAPGADLGGSSNMVTKELVLETMGGWKPVVNHTLKRIERVFLDMISDSLETSLAARRSTTFFAKASEITRDFFRELMKEVVELIKSLIARELYRPITYASKQLTEKKDAWEAELKAQRLKQRGKEYFEDQEVTTFKYPSEEQFRKKLEEVAWVKQTLGKDEYDNAVKELAMPFAYYEIASAQLCDNIARDVEYHLLRAYEVRVHRKLLEGLRTADTAYCAELLAEDPQRERERVALVEEKTKLMQALNELNGLPGIHA